jgi:hypothetical protein
VYTSFSQSIPSLQEGSLLLLKVPVESVQNQIPTLCAGCAVFSPADLNECRFCHKKYCSTCTCSCKQRADNNEVVNQAHLVIRSLSQGLLGAHTCFVVEDEFGDLEAVVGDTARITMNDPIAHLLFCDQLLSNFQHLYEREQLEVWSGKASMRSFSLDDKVSVVILPMLIGYDRYTVSLFTPV